MTLKNEIIQNVTPQNYKDQNKYFCLSKKKKKNVIRQQCLKWPKVESIRPKYTFCNLKSWINKLELESLWVKVQSWKMKFLDKV